MRLSDLVRDGQIETRTAIGSGKRLENSRRILRAQPIPGIGKTDLPGLA